MKAELVSQETFKPVRLILETQEEVDKIYAILNHTVITRTVGIGDAYKELSPFSTPGYDKHHTALCKIIR